MMPWRRTHTCGALGLKAVGEEVVLAGWVHRRRDHGGLIFIDLRDRWGITQVVFDPSLSPQLHERAKELRSEFCVAVKGKVVARPPHTENPKIATGAIEVVANDLAVLNPSITPPFEIAEDPSKDGAPYVQREISEELRYIHRYLDLRRPSVQEQLLTRHWVIRIIRRVLEDAGFVEIETPILTKSTPEGARDYLVPSRLNPGQFYALPQSPQLFKQLLMVAGFDRYYQIARCFRDEDLRADRQPEFTQLDLEMSFVDEETIFSITEEVLAAVWKEVAGVVLPVPFPRLTYAECMRRFGTDKPDLRYGMELEEFTHIFQESPFDRFRQAIAAGGVVYGMVAKGGASLSGKITDGLTDMARGLGAQGLVTIRVTDQGCVCPVAKHLGEEALRQVVSQAGAQPGDLILLMADRPSKTFEVLGNLRVHVAQRLNLVPTQRFCFVWVTEFPLFKYNEEMQRWESEHHPFTAPLEEDMSLLERDPGKVRARSYDLVVNGQELGSGSIRIHRQEVQEAIFRILGLPEEEVQKRFGFLLKAFRFGAPPHGGIAPGIDRMVAILVGASSIREVIAFPKTQKGVDLMVGAPSEVSGSQLKELGIFIHARGER